jgi:hypothetical protein
MASQGSGLPFSHARAAIPNSLAQRLKVSRNRSEQTRAMRKLVGISQIAWR